MGKGLIFGSADRALVALALSLAAFTSTAGRAANSGEPGEATASVRQWLQRIHDAAGNRNFAGTFVVTSAGSISSARIAHYCVADSQIERIESLDGPPRQVFRHNDTVQTLWPVERLVVVEHNPSLLAFPRLLRSGDDRIADFYDLKRLGVGRAAGHEADVLAVHARDALRYGYRLWAERATGLLLRADVIGERGEVLETSAFSEVSLGIKPQSEALLAAMKRTEGYRVVQPNVRPTALEAEGWRQRQAVPGFRQVSCVKRPLETLAPERSAADRALAEPLLQVIYSDGLTHVSLFVERFDAQKHVAQEVPPMGATQTFMQRIGEWWITAVGDVPPGTLRLFVQSLERTR